MRSGHARIGWTDAENEFLRQYGARFSRRVLQKELNLRFGNNRSYQAVKFKCYEMKVRSESFHRPSGIARKWTPGEDLVLRQLLGQKSTKEIAEGIGRTAWSVVTRAHKLGLGCRQTHGRMSVNDAIKKVPVSRQTFLAAAKRIGVEIPFVTRTRREISDEDYEKIREHLEGRRRVSERVRVARVRPVVRVDAPVRVRARKPKPKPEPVIEPRPEPIPEPVMPPAGRLEVLRKRNVCLKAKAYFRKMKEYNATISQVEAVRKSDAKATIAGGRVVHSVDLDVIEEAAVASGYKQHINKGVVIYRPLTKSDGQL